MLDIIKEKCILIKNTELSLKNDIIFQAFFSRKGNEEFLIDFLNALLKIDIRQIEIREEVNLERLSKREKGGRLDLQATLNNGIIVNIELQLRNNKNIEERTTYYSAKVISRETERGTDYKNIKQVIMINILDYELLGFDEFVSETAIVLDKHRDYEVLQGIKWYFVELPKFRKANPDMNEKLNQWLALIDNYDKERIRMAEKNNKTIQKAKLEMRYLTGEAELRRIAELEEKWEMDYISGMSSAKEDGRQEGRKEGKKSTQIETAKKLLKLNMTIKQIVEITELTEEEINNLKDNI